MNKQLTFDLGDRRQYLESVLENKNTGGGSWEVDYDRYKGFILGIRWHDLGGVAREAVEKLSFADALWLIREKRIMTSFRVDAKMIEHAERNVA